jgi:hypothetical protein
MFPGFVVGVPVIAVLLVGAALLAHWFVARQDPRDHGASVTDTRRS